MVDFLVDLTELFAVYYGSGFMRQNVSLLFLQRGRPFTHKFYLDRVVPHQPLLASEN